MSGSVREKQFLEAGPDLDEEGGRASGSQAPREPVVCGNEALAGGLGF